MVRHSLSITTSLPIAEFLIPAMIERQTSTTSKYLARKARLWPTFSHGLAPPHEPEYWRKRQQAANKRKHDERVMIAHCFSQTDPVEFKRKARLLSEELEQLRHLAPFNATRVNTVRVANCCTTCTPKMPINMPASAPEQCASYCMEKPKMIWPAGTSRAPVQIPLKRTFVGGESITRRRFSRQDAASPGGQYRR